MNRKVKTNSKTKIHLLLSQYFHIEIRKFRFGCRIFCSSIDIKVAKILHLIQILCCQRETCLIFLRLEEVVRIAIWIQL